MPDMKTLTLGGETFDIKDDEAVRFTLQHLTESQKKQARENLGAISEDDIDTLSESDVNSLIDKKLGVIENGSY